MQFQSPQSAKCEHCSKISSYQADDLLGLKAICPHCQNLLTITGLKMRSVMDDWTLFVIRVEIAMAIEDYADITLTDERLESIQTLDDLAAMIQPLLPNGYQVPSLIDQVVRSVSTEEPDEIAYKSPLLDALLPSRWN